MSIHVVGRFQDHEIAEKAVVACQKKFPGMVSLSSTTPHSEWWNKDKWLENSLEAIGGVAASVAQVIPGFGVLFLGGPLDGMRQGHVLADWVLAHPHHKENDKMTFVIISVEQDKSIEAEQLLHDLGAQNISRSEETDI